MRRNSQLAGGLRAHYTPWMSIPWKVRALIAGLLCTGAAPVLAAQTRVRIDTELGAIVAEVYADRAPLTVANFLRYVSEGRLDGGVFYRVVTPTNQPVSPVKIEVIQGGLDTSSALRLPPIPHETTDQTEVKHLDGTLSMARGAPGSASSEFFITLGAQPELDFGGRRNPDGQGFAAFGRVVQGMDVVRRIQQGAAAASQRLLQPIRIVRVVRIPVPATATRP